MSDLAASRKVLQVVPCSNPAHNLETYFVGHAGWGQARLTQAAETARARSVCWSTFQQRFGRPISAPYGWYAFWPDPGSEQAKYGDRLECSLIRYPGEPAMGPGRHT